MKIRLVLQICMLRHYVDTCYVGCHCFSINQCFQYTFKSLEYCMRYTCKKQSRDHNKSKETSSQLEPLRNSHVQLYACLYKEWHHFQVWIKVLFSQGSYNLFVSLFSGIYQICIPVFPLICPRKVLHVQLFHNKI